MYILAGSKENDQWLYTKVLCNGIEVPFCIWLDTELGMAECLFGGEINKDHPYKNKISWFLWTPEQELHTYTLHNFEVLDIRTNEIIARV